MSGDAWRRALAALPSAEQALVSRLARVLLAAVRDDLAPANDTDPPDDLARALARRILARHGRRTGGAA